MKNLLNLILILGIVTVANAQITVTNAVFPQAGESFKIMIADNPANILITASGGNQTWDLTNIGLIGVDASFTAGDAAMGSAAADFPTADIIIPEFGGIEGDGYVKVDANEMSTVGVVGTLVGFVDNYPVRFNPAQIEIQTPLTATSSFASSYGFQEVIDPHADPGSTIDSLITEIEQTLGGLITIDSVRVTFTSSRQSDVDAWGTLDLPNGSFNVLRLKSTDETDTQIAAKVSTFGIPNPTWQSPADLGFDVSTFPFLGADTTISYDFWNDVEKMPILSMNANASNTAASFAAYYGDFPTNTEAIRSNETRVRTYPNPAFDKLNIELSNFENNNYTIKMYNIIGKQIWEKSYAVQDERTIKLDVSKLRKGTYLYTIFDENGRRVTTRRFIIIKP